MKSLRTLLVLAGLLLPQLVFATAPRFSVEQLAEEAKPHLVAYEQPPLVNSNQSEPGAAIEIARAAFAAAGMKAEVEVLPSRSLGLKLLADDAKAMGMLGEARTMSAADRKRYSEEKMLPLSGRYYYYRPAHGDWSKISSLSQLKGFTYGAIAGEPVEEMTHTGIKVSVAEPKLQLRKLASREIDFMSAFAPNAERMIAELLPGEAANFAVMPLKSWESSFSIWFNPSHPGAKSWRKRFADGLKTIKQNGVYSQIIRKYHLD